MDELISRVRNGKASSREEAELLAWRRESLENELRYRSTMQMLDEVAEVLVPEDVDLPPLIEDLVSPRLSWSRKAGRVRPFPGARLAAAAIFAAGSLALFFLLGRPSAPGENSFGTGELVTGPSESTTVRLGDGSVVRLGPNSRLRVMGNAPSREVWMEGRAYFAVARDPSRPFRIRTHAGDALVLGTRFDMQARADDMRVVVVEGTVKMEGAGAALQVAANEMGSIADGQEPLRRRLEVEELDQELEWIGDFIAFENTPLSQVAAELTRRFQVPVIVLDSAVARETVRATFTDESLEEITSVLCRAVAVHCSIQDERVTIGL